MSRYVVLFLINLGMVTMLLMAASYHLVIQYAAVSHGETVSPADHFTYALWVFIWVMTVGVGIEVVKDAYRVEREAWIEAQMPPLFPEGVTC